MALRALKAFLFKRPFPRPFREREEDELLLRPLSFDFRRGDLPLAGEPLGVAPGDRPFFGFFGS